MTRAQIEWAKTHDWFVSAWGRGVVVNDFVTGTHQVFDDFEELRAWAGY